MQYQHINIPETGEPITANPDGSLNVPDHPIIVCLRGDGIGMDVTPVMQAVVEAAVKQAYGGRRSIEWARASAGVEDPNRYVCARTP